MRPKAPSSPTTRSSNSPFLSSPHSSPRPSHKPTPTPTPTTTNKPAKHNTMPAEDDSSDLEDSWYPISVSSTADASTRTQDDDERSSNFGSSLSGSIGHLSSDTGDDDKDRWEGSTDEGSLSGEAEHIDRHLDTDDEGIDMDKVEDSEYDHLTNDGDPNSSSLMGGGSYIDAEATATETQSSIGTLNGRGSRSTSDSQIRLIFPNPDLGSSLSSSGMTGSDSTPSASLGNSFRVRDAGDTKLNGSTWSDTSRASQLWAPSPLVRSMVDDKQYQLLSSQDELRDEKAIHRKISPTLKVAEVVIVPPVASKEVPNTTNVRRRDAARDRLVAGGLAQLAKVSKKWLVRLSVVAFASVMLSLAMYQPSSPVTLVIDVDIPPAVLPTTTGRPFSLWNHLPLVPRPDAIIVPPTIVSSGARSAKGVRAATGIQEPNEPTQSPAVVKLDSRRPHLAKANGHPITCCSLSVRDTNVALAPIVSPSVWQKTLRMMCNATVPVNQNTTTVDQCSCNCTYSQIILSDLKSIWSRSLSTISGGDILDFIRQQVADVAQKEYSDLRIMASGIYSSSRHIANITSVTASELSQYAITRSRLRLFLAQDRLQPILGNISAYTAKLRARARQMQVRAPFGREAADQAKRGLNILSHKAGESAREVQEKGTESLKQARRGLDAVFGRVGVIRKQGVDLTYDSALLSGEANDAVHNAHNSYARGADRRYGRFWIDFRSRFNRSKRGSDLDQEQHEKSGAGVREEVRSEAHVIPRHPVQETSKWKKALEAVHHAAMPFVI